MYVIYRHYCYHKKMGGRKRMIHHWQRQKIWLLIREEFPTPWPTYLSIAFTYASDSAFTHEYASAITPYPYIYIPFWLINPFWNLKEDLIWYICHEQLFYITLWYKKISDPGFFWGGATTPIINDIKINT